MKIIKLIPLLNPLILGSFFILFLYANNLGEGIDFFEVISLFLVVSIFSYSVFFTSIFIFKNVSKASFYSLVLLFIFYSYGYLYDLLNEITFISEFSRHRFLIPLIFTLLLLMIFQLVKKDWRLENFHKIFLITFSTLLIINTFTIINSDLRKSNPLVNNIDINLDQKYKDIPDVYHIVLDMYPTEDILSKRFGFDNSNFINELKSMGFRKENMKSNYISTMYSIPSTINMTHFYNSTPEQINYMGETHYSFSKSVEAFYAKNIGYEIHEISTDNIKGFYGYFLGDFSRIFFKTNIIRAIDDSQLKLHKLWTNIDQKYFNENINELVNLSKNNKPTWVYFYSRPPHPPFIFNEDGSKNLILNPYNEFAEDLSDSWDSEDKLRFIEQLKYVNKTVLESVDKILSNSSNSIIIIHSDHGIHNYTTFNFNENKNMPKEAYEELFSTINFIYSPDKCIKEDQLIKSNINIISTLFRECFKLNIEDKENIQLWNPGSNINEFVIIEKPGK